jgi:hypothetical protein
MTLATRIQGADRGRHMPICRVCEQPKVDQQRLAIDATGRLIHASCKRSAWLERGIAKEIT